MTVNLWDFLYLYRAIVLFESHPSFLGTTTPKPDVSERLNQLTTHWQPILESRRSLFASKSDSSQEQVQLEVAKDDMIILEQALKIILEQARPFQGNVKVHVGPLNESVPALMRVYDTIRSVLGDLSK